MAGEGLAERRRGTREPRPRGGRSNSTTLTGVPVGRSGIVGVDPLGRCRGQLPSFVSRPEIAPESGEKRPGAALTTAPVSKRIAPDHVVSRHFQKPVPAALRFERVDPSKIRALAISAPSSGVCR